MTPIAAFVKDVGNYLTSKLKIGSVDTVVFGHEGFVRDVPQEPKAIFTYADEGDTYAPPGTTRGPSLPAKSWFKSTGCMATIYGASNVDGASEDDHKQVVEQFVDNLLVAMLAVAHSSLRGYANTITNVKGAFIPFELAADGTQGQAEFGARYELHFAFNRAVIDPAPQKIAQTNLVPSPQGVLVTPQTNVAPITGAHASITAVAGGKATVGGLSGMSSSVVGLVMVISGASTPKNNGTFAITDFVDAATVKVANTNAVAPDGFNGNLMWSVPNAELEVA